MIKDLALQMLRAWVKELQSNPRGILIRICTRDANGKWHRDIIAMIQAVQVGEILGRQHTGRVMEIEIGPDFHIKFQI